MQALATIKHYVLQTKLWQRLGSVVSGRLTSTLLICDAACRFVFQNPDHQVVMPTVGADVAFGLGR